MKDYRHIEEQLKKTVEVETINKNTELAWYVFEEDVNAREIEIVNILHKDGLLFNDIKKEFADRYTDMENFETFCERVKRNLMYYYWSKSEHEIVLTSWPPYIESAELDRLIEEKDKDIEKYGRFIRTNVNLTVGSKVDVYTQVALNWNRFIHYLWDNRVVFGKNKLKKEKETK